MFGVFKDAAHRLICESHVPKIRVDSAAERRVEISPYSLHSKEKPKMRSETKNFLRSWAIVSWGCVSLAMTPNNGRAQVSRQHTELRLATSPDERDRIVAEYKEVCHQTISRADLVATIAPFNTSDYPNWQRNAGDLKDLYGKVLAGYRGSEIVDETGNALLVNGKRVRIPIAAKVRVSSGWRNPKRNNAVGSVVGCNSKHLLGRALDLVPEPIAGEVEGGASTTVDVKKYLFPTLWAAAKAAGFAIAEAGSVPVPCGSFEDHVHVHR
jgi:hypothetical protein